MASLYIHVPFCKKACHYCSFYFVLSQNKKNEFIHAISQELEQRKDEINDEPIQSIYFGGGTPSILSKENLDEIFKTIFENYNLAPQAEIGIESNPENLSLSYLLELKSLGINRLSIGIQSFFDEDLAIMNRNHKSIDAIEAISHATKIFDNVSIDLMFGLPYSGMERWKDNLQKAVELGVQHISTYNLTIEEKTALANKVKRNELPIESDETLNEMYNFTIEYLESNGLKQYEISNFGRQGFWSQHNIGYWKNTNYLGFGPSAHSFNGSERRWNESNLNNYISSIQNNTKYWSNELLTMENKYNEYLLTRLRTIFGLDISEIRTTFGQNYADSFENDVSIYLLQNQIIKEGNIYRLTNEGKILADFISSNLMM